MAEKKKIRKGNSSSSDKPGDVNMYHELGIDHKTVEEWHRAALERSIQEAAAYRPLKKPAAPKTFEIPILEDDQDLDPTDYYQKRLKKVADRKASRLPVYANKLSIARTMPIPEFLANYKSLKPGVMSYHFFYRAILAGRLVSKVYSSDVITYGLIGFGGQIQVKAFPSSEICTDEFLDHHSDFRVGDYVGVDGFPAIVAGELCIVPDLFIRLSYCLHKMPPVLPFMKEFDASTPESGGYPGAFNLIDQANSPVLAMFPGGADAHPFVIPYDDLDKKMFLEIAPELYLKQFVDGGKERVYVIGQQYRNVGIHLIRCPEFMCEFYMVLADSEYLMKLTEQILSGVVKELTGGYKVAYHANGYDNNPIEIDFTPPFRRLSMIEELGKRANLSIPKDLASEEARKYLANACTKFDINCAPPQTTARLLEKLARHFLEVTCVNPTFIMEHPKIMSPRAKSHVRKSGLTERFQLFVNKFELINSYTEENDPFVHRFANQVKDQQSGGRETVLCAALDYGLPPTGGWVLGIDRLTMLLTDSQNIKTGSYTFPTVKPQLHHEQTIKEDIVPSEVN